MPADPADLLLRHVAWHTYTPADGLAGLYLQQLAQDHDGHIWISTFHSGASRFDGDSFRTYTRADGLTSNMVMALCPDRQNRLWFGVAQGRVCWYDGRCFHQVEALNRIDAGAGQIFEDREGRIWFCGGKTLCYLDGDRVVDLRADLERDCGFSATQAWGVAQSPDGDIWVGMRQLLRYDGARFHAFGPAEGMPESAEVYTVGVDAGGHVWAGDTHRILRFNGQSFDTVHEQDLLVVRQTRLDAEGRLWFGTKQGAFYHDGQDLRRLATAGAVADANVADVLQDREGLLWVATWGDGLSRCDPSILRVGNDPETGDLLEAADGTAWVTTPRGLARLNRDTLSVEPPLAATFDKPTRLCTDGDGGLWLGGLGGLAHWGGRVDDPVERPEGFADDHVSDLLFDPDRGLFVAHQDAGGRELRISHHDGTCWHLLLQRPRKSSFSIIHRLRIWRDQLWLALGGSMGHAFGEAGIARLEPDGDITLYGVDEGLVDPRVEDILEARDGNLWVATRGGLSRFDGETFQNFTAEDGLPVPGVLWICETDEGHLWLGADGGLVRFDGTRFQLVRSSHLLGVWRVHQDSDGLWCSTRSGVVRYRPMTVPPRVHVERVVTDAVHEGIDTDAVRAHGGQVTFEWRGMSSRTPGRDLLYTYRLHGVDEDWHADTRQRHATYTDLQPGSYRFEVRAFDRDLNESPPATCHLTVLPDPRLTALSRELGAAGGPGEFVGSSSALRRVEEQLAQVAPLDLTVLILGETGTGKGLAACAVHRLSPHRDGPLIQVNCGAIPAALVESELFGHERGAFTGAVQRQIGKVELAAGGTLFLDEIGDMPLEAQVRLLRLLEERTFERVGGSQTLKADARVVAATNRDLEAMVAAETFREDLYYRLRVFPVSLPPLRERQQDIPLLAVFFMQRMAEHLSKDVQGFTPEALTALRAGAWPGNVRELEHTVQRAVIVCHGSTITAGDLGLTGVREDDAGDPAAEGVSPQEYERRYLLQALEACGWVIKGAAGAAARLDMPVSTLRTRMRRLNIRRPTPPA